MKKLFYVKTTFYYVLYLFSIKVYKIEGNIPRLITTLKDDENNTEVNIINYLLKNNLGDGNSKLIRL